MPITAFSSFTDGLDLDRRHYREAGLDARQLDLLVRWPLISWRARRSWAA